MVNQISLCLGSVLIEKKALSNYFLHPRYPYLWFSSKKHIYWLRFQTFVSVLLSTLRSLQKHDEVTIFKFTAGRKTSLHAQHEFVRSWKSKNALHYSLVPFSPIGFFSLYVLFTQFRPFDATLGNSFFQVSSYACANVRITYEKNKRKILTRTSPGLKWEKKTHRQRSI